MSLPSHESYPPFRQPAQMKMCGMCSMYPAFRYIPSHNVLLMTGTETSCNTLGNGPSFEQNNNNNNDYKPDWYNSLMTILQQFILFALSNLIGQERVTISIKSLDQAWSITHPIEYLYRNRVLLNVMMNLQNFDIEAIYAFQWQLSKFMRFFLGF